MSENTYVVGYKKPPVAARFKKGVSPNPGGRSKKSVDPNETPAERVWNRVVSIPVGGKTRRMSFRKATVETHAARALQGNMDSIEILFALRKPDGKPPHRGPQIIVAWPENMKMTDGRPSSR
jgi:Family of unknown function (DUF5681)